MSTRTKPDWLPIEALELVAARFRVLGEPQRLRLLRELHGGERSVSQLAEALGTTQPNVSKHLRLLQETGLVARRQEGNSAFYSIADPIVSELCELVCAGLQRKLTADARVLAALEPSGPRRRRGRA